MDNNDFVLVICAIEGRDGYEYTTREIENCFKKYLLEQIRRYSLEELRLITLFDVPIIMEESGINKKVIEDTNILIETLYKSIDQNDGKCATIEQSLYDSYFSHLIRADKEKINIDGERIIVRPLGQNKMIEKNVVPSL